MLAKIEEADAITFCAATCAQNGKWCRINCCIALRPIATLVAYPFAVTFFGVSHTRSFPLNAVGLIRIILKELERGSTVAMGKIDTDILPENDRRKLIRNLALSIQTVSSCGHAMRVTVADMLQDFENIRALSESDAQVLQLFEALEQAVRDDIAQNRQVFTILGLKIPQN